jgi:HK97 gp10 family phage protein
MAKVTMSLTGMEGLQRALKVAPDLVQIGAGDAVLKTAFAIAQRARSLAPVRTGALRNAIAAASRSTSGRVGLDKALPYWRFVEFGTVHQRAHPYFRPAAEAESSLYVERLRRVGRDLERDLSTSSLT